LGLQKQTHGELQYNLLCAYEQKLLDDALICELRNLLQIKALALPQVHITIDIKEDPLFGDIRSGTYEPSLQPRRDSHTNELVPANRYKDEKIKQRNQLWASGAYRGNCVYIVDHPLQEWVASTTVAYEWMHKAISPLPADAIYSPNVEPRVVKLLQKIGVTRARNSEADLYLLAYADEIKQRGGLDIVFADVHGGYREGASKVWRVIESRPWLLSCTDKQPSIFAFACSARNQGLLPTILAQIDEDLCANSFFRVERKHFAQYGVGAQMMFHYLEIFRCTEKRECCQSVI
jgi:hypothetical protein